MAARLGGSPSPAAHARRLLYAIILAVAQSTETPTALPTPSPTALPKTDDDDDDDDGPPWFHHSFVVAAAVGFIIGSLLIVAFVCRGFRSSTNDAVPANLRPVSRATRKSVEMHGAERASMT
jgi:hypothetical protein